MQVQMPMDLLGGCHMGINIYFNSQAAGHSLENIISIQSQVPEYHTKVSGSKSPAWQTFHKVIRGGRAMPHGTFLLGLCLRC